METIETIMHNFAGHGLIEKLTQTLLANDPAFEDAEKQYQQATRCLRDQLPEAFSPSLDDCIQAHERDIISRVAYAGYLGFRVNLENFHHPMRVEFLNMDTIDYVKDHMMGHFPVNYDAAEIVDAFQQALPEHLEAYGDTISAYFVHLECSGPKLAHYAGYMIANHLLPWIEPGYRADWCQTSLYREQVRGYMGYLPL